MAKQTDTDPIPRAALTKTAPSSSQVESKDSRRVQKDEDLSAEDLLRGLVNGPRAPFRASQAAQSDGDDAVQFHAGPRALQPGREDPSPEAGIVLSPSVVESAGGRERGAGSQAVVPTFVLPRVERRKTARRLAAGALLLALLVCVVDAAIVLLRSHGGGEASSTTPSATASSMGRAVPSAVGTTAEIQTTAPMTEPSTSAPESPNAAPTASPKRVQAKPPAAPRPSSVPSVRPVVREKAQDDLPPEF
jgi:hypothetical protein